MKKEKPRKSIRRRVLAVLLCVSIAALLATDLLWLGSLFVVRNRVASDSSDLGETAYSVSVDTVTSLGEQNYIVTAENRAQTIDAILERYLGYVADFAFYAHRLLESPEEYVMKEVLPPHVSNAYHFVLQLCYADENADREALAPEVGLLANAVHIWQPVMESANSQIGSIYLSTESGFMINYDERSDLTPEIFDYFEKEWYTVPRDTGEVILTDAYEDAFGRGLMVTCAAPFYNVDQSFAGVMCIDILINDLGNVLSDVDLGDGSYVYLVDGAGKVILSPDGFEETAAESLTEEERSGGSLASHIMTGKSGGEYGGIDGSMFFAYSPIKSANWMVVFQIPSHLLTDPSTNAAKAIGEKTEATVGSIHKTILTALLLNLGALVIVYIAIAAASRIFSKQLTEPLLELGEDVAVISGGDLAHRAEICDIGEIGDLARSFNDMAESLDGYIRDLTAVTAERERIGAELGVAKHIQASMLPCIFPAFPDRDEFDIYATMTPAKEVGGDFYDFFMVDKTHLAIVMADVSGKGVPAALFMVIGKTLIKDHTEPDEDLGEVFGEVNNLLCKSNSEGLFITAFEGVLDLVTGEFRFVNAGHEMPFISKSGGEFKPYKIKPGFVLAGMEDMKYKSGSIILDPGDRIFQYTDGVTEATDKDNRLYGMERLEAVLCKNSTKPPEEILKAVKEDIDRFVGEAEQFDDITMLALEYKKKMEGTP